MVSRCLKFDPTIRVERFVAWSGSLRSTLAHMLHWPTSCTQFPDFGQVADPTNPSLRRLFQKFLGLQNALVADLISIRFPTHRKHENIPRSFQPYHVLSSEVLGIQYEPFTELWTLMEAKVSLPQDEA